MFGGNTFGGGVFGGGARPAGTTPANTFGQSSFFSQPQGPTTSFDFVGSTFNTKNRDGYLVASITANINQISLEELRINDHFAMKRNLLPDQKKQNIESIIQNNIRKRDGQPGSIFGGGSFPGANPNPTPTPIPQAGGIFGQQEAPTGMFGNQPPAQLGLLGQPQGNLGLQPPSNLLGSNPQSVFGLSTLPPPSSGGLFGSFNPPTQTPEKSSTEPTSTTGFLGGTAPQQTASLTQPSLLTSTTAPSLFPPVNSSSNSFFAQPPPTGHPNVFNPQEASAPVQNQEKPLASTQSKLDSFFGVSKNPQPQSVTQPAVVNPPKAVVEQKNVNVQPVIIAPGEFKTQTVSSKPGGFSHEMNKMLFVSSLMELFGEHNIVFPEDLLETTDFMQKLFEFLATYDIKPPQKFVPRFKINKSAVLAVIPPESRDDYREKEAEAQQSQSQQIVQKPLVVQKEEEKKEEPKKVTGLEIKTKQSQPVKEDSEKEESEEREESDKEGSAVVIGESNETGHEDNQ